MIALARSLRGSDGRLTVRLPGSIPLCSDPSYFIELAGTRVSASGERALAISVCRALVTHLENAFVQSWLEKSVYGTHYAHGPLHQHFIVCGWRIRNRKRFHAQRMVLDELPLVG